MAPPMHVPGAACPVQCAYMSANVLRLVSVNITVHICTNANMRHFNFSNQSICSLAQLRRVVAMGAVHLLNKEAKGGGGTAAALASMFGYNLP